MSHVSHTTCHMSHVMCIILFGQNGEASWWRFCYHWCLSCLVIEETDWQVWPKYYWIGHDLKYKIAGQQHSDFSLSHPPLGRLKADREKVGCHGEPYIVNMSPLQPAPYMINVFKFLNKGPICSEKEININIESELNPGTTITTVKFIFRNKNFFIMPIRLKYIQFNISLRLVIMLFGCESRRWQKTRYRPVSYIQHINALCEKPLKKLNLSFHLKMHYLSHFGQTKKSETMYYKLSSCISIILSPWI